MIALRTVVAAAAITLAVPAMAQAKTKEIYAGSPPATTKKLGEATVANAFYPGKLKVNVGDSVKFVPAGFHNVHLPKKGDGVTPFLIPTGQKVAGSNDAAGAPFWFNGQDAIGPNPALFTAAGFGKKFTYSGAAEIQSGLPGEGAKPMTVKFSKTGTYKVYCDIHPGMEASVTVAKKGAKVPTAKQDAATVKKEGDATVKAAKGLETKTQPANTVALGSATKGGIEYLGMVPASLTVKSGTTVKFTMTKGSFEPHTATFGPGDVSDPNSYVGVIAKSFESPAIDPRGLYPSDVTPVSLSPTTHGNGFWSTGVLDAYSQTPQPMDASVKFDTPGTYKYLCVIHPFMQGSITVQ
ncbi:plastocyanin/azurin family copper-binding protein [Solirubrobacter phytolaccae]|uniref:Plastocyanin/azurin family copper-binding protein n=1 Tax=Solirubrobacter phytolaccae TaxID=1404360 RepID=A0A9X3SGR9_9ACTN|nr:plastocyanin/azurin family copper-binding protein [Solirubrobacter phytolaccae]MDA0182717.1 plastocyanin/azurin family copper-binding protein [Solirubrobacter phytolaccae]